jgi:hypothetical protein
LIFLRNARSNYRRKQWLICSCISIGLLAFADCVFNPRAFAQDADSGDTSQRIYGTVVNSVTHAPIARALVTYAGDFAVLTDNDGHFEFTVPSRHPPGGGSHGIYRPNARKPGYFEAPYGSQIEAASSGEFTIPLVPEAIIKGRVALSASEPASQITVQLYTRQVQSGFFRWMPGEMVQAGSNGEFHFAELQAGSYEVLTHEFMDNDPIDTNPGGQLFGYPPVYFPNATDFASGATIQLSAGEVVQADVLLVRHPYYPVQIPIVNPDLAPGFLAISVLPHGRSSPGYSLGYNFIKKRIEGQLPDGNYDVEAVAFGEHSASGMTNLTVADASAENSSMALHPNGSIALNVREESISKNEPRTGSWSDGRHTFTYAGPRTYLQAYVESADDFEQRGGSLRAPRQDNDSLVIDNLSPGRYWLRLDTSLGYVASATMGGIDLLHQPFVFGAGSNTPIEITMRDDFAEIEGSVAGMAGAATASGPAHGQIGGGLGSSKFIFGFPAYVYCIPLSDSPGQFQQIGINSDGKFSSQTIPPGTYRILAFKEAQLNLPYRDPEAMKAYETKGQVVHLSAGQKTTVELQLISEAD